MELHPDIPLTVKLGLVNATIFTLPLLGFAGLTGKWMDLDANP